jgi:hypothetical protein
MIYKILLILCFSLIPSFLYSAEYDQFVGDATGIVNAKREARGLTLFIPDQELKDLCNRITYTRGLKLYNGHLRNNGKNPHFSEKANFEGVGWGGTDMDGSEFHTCYYLDRFRGQTMKFWAAYCVDDSGRTFYTIILKSAN